MRNTKRALLWIVKILKSHHVPFLISGGFVAKIYGSDRPLFDNQVIDICGAYKTKIFNKTNKEWVVIKNNLKNKNFCKVYGVSVPLTPIKELIRYKLILRRGVDLIDVENLKKTRVV